jgi:hypothetical protein
MVRNKDPSVVAALPTDDLATSERIDSPEAGLLRQATVNPTGLQRRVIRGGQVRSQRPRSPGRGVVMNMFGPNNRPVAEGIFVFSLRVEVVYTFVERIQVSPP